MTSIAILQAETKTRREEAAALLRAAGEMEQQAKRNHADAGRLTREADAMDADIATLSSAPMPKDQEPHGRSAQGRPRRS